MYSKSEKICSFYVSGLHLATILMEYIYEKTKEGRKILNILENDIAKEADSVIELFDCKQALKSDIRNIGWNKTSKESITKLLEAYNSEDIIIIAGSQKFVEFVKAKVPSSCTVIDCYELFENASETVSVLNEHEYILMTDGIKKIAEVFK